MRMALTSLRWIWLSTVVSFFFFIFITFVWFSFHLKKKQFHSRIFDRRLSIGFHGYRVDPLFSSFSSLLKRRTQFYLVLPNDFVILVLFRSFTWANSISTQFYLVLPSFTQFYLVLPSFTQFYLVLPTYTEFLPRITKF